jgi:hypothetical protein
MYGVSGSPGRPFLQREVTLAKPRSQGGGPHEAMQRLSGVSDVTAGLCALQPRGFVQQPTLEATLDLGLSWGLPEGRGMRPATASCLEVRIS